MELTKDASDEIERLRQRFNARYVSERPLTWEHYINGQAYLEWRLCFAALGRWDELFLVAKKVDPILVYELGLVGSGDVPVSEIASPSDRQHSPVFVHQVEFVEVDERVYPSWIWAKVSDYLHGDLAGFPSFVFKALFEVGRAVGSREARISGRLSVGRGARRDKIVERGPKIVNGIADDGGEDSWRRLYEGNVIPMLARIKIRFHPDSVSVLTEVGEDEIVHLSDVRLRALQLQKRA